MSNSCLSGRIDVCTSISKLNKDGCNDVIRLLQNVLGLDDLNQFVTKIFMDCSNNWTIDQIMQFENEMKQTLNNHMHHENYNPSQPHSRKDDPSMNNEVQFPLLRLPIDLITKTSFYLNENDIFKFERCCRLFYKMINNSSYLSLSNNFKTFIIKDETLDEMRQRQCSFFKYSKTKCVKLSCDSNLTVASNERKIETHFIELRGKWEKAKQICINRRWFNDVFKSIEILETNADGMMLLDKLPIELLFDPIEAHLNKIQFSHYWNLLNKTYLKQYIYNFERQYLEIQHKLEKQGKQMRKLICVKHCDIDEGFEGPLCIAVEHLHLSLDIRIQFVKTDFNKNWLSRHYNPRLQKLTCDGNFNFENINVEQGNDVNKKQNTNIETLRLRYLNSRSSCDIFNNKIVIESLNFQNSLKNLMLSLDVSSMDNQKLTQWQDVIESILKKERFYKLENVIFVFCISSHDIDWIVEMLKKNVQLLKYQFKQFIIGLLWYANSMHSYHAFEWNKSIDTNYLDHLKALCKQSHQEPDIQDQMQQKYSLLWEKWSS